MGLLGQELGIYNEQNLGNVEWSNATTVNQPLTWYKVNYVIPSYMKVKVMPINGIISCRSIDVCVKQEVAIYLNHQ